MIRAALGLGLLVACGDDKTPSLDATIDGVVDGVVDPCAACTADQVCVQRFDGTCGLGTQCLPREGRTCAPNTCSMECEQAYCPSPYQCQTRPPCGTESPTSFRCYGP